jgi:1-acyl-sn-glycerol-3-phosphate acyltransferase
VSGKLVRLSVHRRKVAREEGAYMAGFFRTAAQRCRQEGAIAGAVVIVFPDGTLGTAFEVGDKWAEVVAGVATLAHRLQEES